MNKFKKYCISLSISVVIFSTISNVYALNNYREVTNKSNENMIQSNNDKQEKKFDSSKKNKGVSNILLIGSDSKNFDNVGRSDAMMILTIDDKNKSIKLTSLVRDTLVNIPGHGYEKLTHAYAYGGAKLLLDTIEQNFKISIKDYAAVNFNSFIDLVDVLGGVEVNVKEKEIDHLNDVIVNSFNTSNKEAEEPQFIRSDGKQLLNGYQALAYARIRKVDSIYERDTRQREVLKSIADKLVELPITNYPKVIKKILPYVDVNISMSKLINLAITSKEIYNYELKQMEFPLEDYRESGRLAKDNSFVVKWNKTENLKKLDDFIYNN
ncbi:MAG: LCP family protein [Paeniclostridium sordellii]|uniref:LCP family protein n=1 Tax=Paeniclostridium hominis TaxID=2764329 RepID=A0ABR7K069_9FIRM|nr:MULTISPECIES: LCP family protein [Paeniclostridium]MBC6002391.1 LCP family protein [Paeniclostridium hominis]MDU2592305.1 LCP family protein [Paeniclostridium sordellii]